MTEKPADYVIPEKHKISKTKRFFKVLGGKLYREVFCWRTFWCSLSLWAGVIENKPNLGVACLFLWVLFMILDQLKLIVKALSK